MQNSPNRGHTGTEPSVNFQDMSFIGELCCFTCHFTF